MNDMNHAVLQRLSAAGLELSGGWIKTPTGPRWHSLIVSLRYADTVQQRINAMKPLHG